MKWGIKPRYNHLEGRILFYFVITTLIASFIVGLFSYSISVKILKNRISLSCQDTLLYVGKNIQTEFDNMKKIADYLFINQDIKDMINKYPERDYECIRCSERITSTVSQALLSNIIKNINTVIILKDNNKIYQYNSKNDATQFFVDNITKNEYYLQAFKENKIKVLGESYSPMFSSSKEKTLSLFRPIFDQQYSKKIGGMYLSFNVDIINNNLIRLSKYAGTEMLLISYDGKSITYSEHGISAELHKKIMQHSSSGSNMITFEDPQIKKMIFCYFIPKYSCYIVDMIPVNQLIKDNRLILYTSFIAFLITMFFSYVIWNFMKNEVITPLNAINKSLKHTIAGNYQEISIEKPGEIVEINTLVNSYNDMIHHIDYLIDKLADEKTIYKDLEYKALQFQINSHFINNTLNSIRWLAIIQKADNIKNIIDSFSRLLKSSWQGMEKDTTLRCEMENLKDYIFIQQIAHSYKCEIIYDIEDSILECKCLKFILQPIVENAFFHGIAPKNGNGKIKITIKSCIFNNAPSVKLLVWDDGVGMDSSAIDKMLGDKSARGRFNGIGVANIHDRLKIKYGSEYGVHVESVPDVYTEVTIYIPVIYPDNSEYREEIECV